YWMKTFQILYSIDGTDWLYYNDKETLTGNTNGNDVAIINIDQNIEARYLLILPITWNNQPGIRMELFGCPKEVPANEYTMIENDIVDDESLFLHLSPYVVSKQIVIRPSGALTIKAGVRVLFTTADAGIIVHGNLNIQGIENLPVVFTADEPVRDMSSLWSGLSFVSGQSSLQHAYVEGASVGIQATGYSVTLDHVTITKCSAGIKFTNGASSPNHTIISDSHILNNGGHGIEFKGSTVNPFLTIFRTVVKGNRGSGLFCKDTHANISVQNSELSYNAKSGVDIHQVEGSINVLGAKVLRNRNDGVRINGIRGESTINSTELAYNHYRVVYYSDVGNYRGGLIRLTNNSFIKGMNTAYGYNIYFDNWYFNGNAIFIENNWFNDIVTSSTSLLMINRFSSKLYISIRNNVFYNCYQSMYIRTYDGTEVLVKNNEMKNSRANDQHYDVKVISEGTNGIFNIIRNRFSNLSASSWLWIDTDAFTMENNSFELFKSADQCAFYVDVSKPDIFLNASYSYWGSSDPGDVKQRVCGNSRIMELAHINVSPFYTDSSLTILNVDEEVDFFFTDTKDAIGGVIVENETIPHIYNHTYHVRRNIFILPNATLTVESGVQLEFDQGIGIHILGQLFIREGKNGDIIMSGKKWGGVYVASLSSEGLALNGVQIDGSTYGIHGSGRDIALNNVTISNTEHAMYIYDTPSKYINIAITDSFVNTTSGSGIHIETPSSVIERFDLKIERVIMQRSGGVGYIYVKGRSGKVESTFAERSFISIVNNTFYSTDTEDTSAIELTDLSHFSSIVIKDNTINGTSRTACVLGLNSGIGTVDIIGNVISESNGALSLTSTLTSG
ncbi:unnamed protein product, partial [Owenia fusiformis]